MKSVPGYIVLLRTNTQNFHFSAWKIRPFDFSAWQIRLFDFSVWRIRPFDVLDVKPYKVAVGPASCLYMPDVKLHTSMLHTCLHWARQIITSITDGFSHVESSSLYIGEPWQRLLVLNMDSLFVLLIISPFAIAEIVRYIWEFMEIFYVLWVNK